MIFFRTHNLAEKLHKNEVTEREGIYYLMGGILIALVSNLLANIWVWTEWLNAFSMIIPYLIAFLTIPLLYKLNKRWDGKDFIFRYICLQLPISINLFIITFCFSIILWIFILFFPFIGQFQKEISHILATIIMPMVNIYLYYSGFKTASKK